MFVLTSEIRKAAPSTHKSKITKLEKWMTGIPLDVSSPVPTVFLIAAGISESDTLWVYQNVSQVPGDENKLKAALRAANEKVAESVFSKKSVSVYSIISEFSQADLQKAVIEFAKKTVADPTPAPTPAPVTEPDATADEQRESDTATTTATMIDPTDRAALFLAILNFTGKPAEIVDAFLVPKEDVKVDNAPVGGDTEAPTSTPIFEAASTAIQTTDAANEPSDSEK